MSEDQLKKAQDIIRQDPGLIWYTKSYDTLPLESITEAILNYGTWDQFQTLVATIGIKQTASTFHKLNSHPRSNLHKLPRNYFQHYFAKYAQ